ncbi:MAG: WbqC family protein [Patescibacteria group bacterium]
MTISAHQPEYLPYLGFFYKMAMVDKFVLVDHIQFSTGDFQNRNRIRTASDPRGWAWLTVPVITGGKGYQKINEVEIDNSVPWARQHWKAIYFNYKKTPFFNIHEDFFKKLYSKKWEKLTDLNENIIYYLKEKMGIDSLVAKSSDYDLKGYKTDLIVELCKKFKADAYLSGPGLTGEGREHYIEGEKLKKNNIELFFSEFKHPVYSQRFAPFIENLSVIDLLFNEGPKSLDIIKNKKI